MLYEQVQQNLRSKPKTWLLTGVAGFIGSHLLEKLLSLDQKVIGLDNFSTGSHRNLAEALAKFPPEKQALFQLVEGDIRDFDTCLELCKRTEIVLQQAALGSVPRSIANPRNTHQNNVDGFFNILLAAKEAHIKRFVYASSSSVYGDHPGLPKVEDVVGRLLSPYAVTKFVNELYASVFSRVYDLECIGLRYFNVFGPRQDPNGPYAAVIPKWFGAMLHGEPVSIFGDGETSRDFCYVANVVQANILAACTDNAGAIGQAYNIAYGERTSLNELFRMIRDCLDRNGHTIDNLDIAYKDFRTGDVRHSLADTAKAATLLGYQPTYSLPQGLEETASWYIQQMTDRKGTM